MHLRIKGGAKLAALGVHTIGQLAACDRAWLAAHPALSSI